MCWYGDSRVLLQRQPRIGMASVACSMAAAQRHSNHRDRELRAIARATCRTLHARRQQQHPPRLGLSLLLRSRCCDLNVTNHAMELPLYIAALRGHAECVRLLLEASVFDPQVPPCSVKLCEAV